MNDITVLILTYNEEKHIARCIESAQTYSKTIYIIDSFSTDRTLEIAKNFNVQIYQNKFINYSTQYKWALKNINIDTKWILRLDADEYLEDNLINALNIKLPNISNNIVGINFKRKHIFMNRWIRYGGRYPLILLRLWKKGHGTIEDRWHDEHIIIHNGKTVTFTNNFVDHNLEDVSFFVKKHNRYSRGEAIEVLSDKLNLRTKPKTFNAENSNLNSYIKRSIKEKIYNKLPFGWGSFFYFLYRYFILMGFLDGKVGFSYHFLQGFWYRFLVETKVLELEKKVAHLDNKNDILSELSKITNSQHF